MEISRLLLVTFTLMSTWMNAAAQWDGSSLARFLPKRTFIIRDTRFDQPVVSGPPAVFGRPANRTPIRPRLPINPQQVVSTKPRTPTFSQLPVVVDQQSEGHNQPSPQQVVPQAQSLPFNGDRPQVPSRRPSKRQRKCGVLPPTGECRAAFPRYYYNSSTDQCDCYLYGGCGIGALNYGYRTLEECHASCLPSNLEEGPVCKELFQDDGEEEVYFDSPAPTHQQPNVDQIPDDVLLSILVNSVSPEEFATYYANQGVHGRNGRSGARNF